MSTPPVERRLWRSALVSLLGMAAGALAVRLLGGVPEAVVAVTVALVAFVVAVARAIVLRPDRLLSASRTKEELVELVESSSADGTLGARLAQLLTRSARFNDTTVAEILTPRTAIVALPESAVGADLAELARRSGLSRALLHRGDLDDVVGVVHVKSLLNLDPAEREMAPLAALATEVLPVPQTLPLRDLLAEMRSRRTWLAVVLDEYGGTAGIVTVEDVLEALVGDIDDEHDRALGRRRVVRLAGTSVLPGDMNLAEVDEAIGLELPEGPYETLGGFVMTRLGRIPNAGDGFDLAGHRIEVLEMDRHRVAAVRVVEPTVVREMVS